MNPWRDLGRLPREVWILFAATLINRAGTMAMPFLVLYLTKSLGLPASRAGLALACYGVGALVTSPLAGRLCDYVGALRIMKLSLLLTGAILLAFPLAQSFPVILAMTFVWAVLSEAFRPASLVITADVVAPEQLKPAFALSRLAVNLGMSIGSAIGGFLAMVSFPALFFVDGATAILAGIVLAASRWRTRQPAASPETKPKEESGGLIRGASALTDYRFLYFLMALIPVGIVFFQQVSALPLYMVRDLGLPESAFGMLIPINTVLVVLVEVPLNTAMARWSHRWTLVLGTFLFAVGFGGLMFATGFLSICGSVSAAMLGGLFETRR
jgi:predicted MFS family arabinose efflux permease